MNDYGLIILIFAALIAVGIYLSLSGLGQRGRRSERADAMPEAKAIVERSPLLLIYRHELWGLSKSIQSGCEELFTKAPASISDENGNPSSYIKISVELHALIREVLAAAHVIRNLLDDRPKRKNEGERAFKIRERRAQMLREDLGDVDLKPLLNSNVRNSLEHMEERIDRTVLEHADGRIKEPGALFNVVLSSRRIIHPELFFLRVYVADERTYHNARTSIDIERMYKTACLVVDKIAVVLRAEGSDEPGGLIVRFS